MSLSDCPKCWNTPCTCGHMGYTTVFHKDGASINMRMDRLEAEIAALKAEVARLASPNKASAPCVHEWESGTFSYVCKKCGLKAL